MKFNLRIQAITSLVLFAGMQCVSWAQAPVDAAELKRVLAKYRDMKSLAVPFRQIKTLKDVQIQLESEGLLRVDLPNKIEWKVLKPHAMSMQLEGDTIRLIEDGKTQQFNMNEATDKDRRGFGDLLNWLKLDADKLVQRYKITKLAEREYAFEPREKMMSIRSLRMRMNVNGHLEQLLFTEEAGDEIVIHFAKPQLAGSRKP